MSPRRRDIEAAIAAHNRADREPWLPPAAAHLLSAMFRRSSVCRRSLDDLAAEGFSRRTVSRLLQVLVSAGFLSKESGPGRPGVIGIYRLHLPPQAQP
jgi:hypothetical protein